MSTKPGFALMLSVINLDLMGAGLLITLREGLEISLVLAIIFAYIDHRPEPGLHRRVWIGTGTAALACITGGWIIFAAVGGLHGKSEQAVEGVLALTAVLVLTWMIFWMRANAMGLSSELHKKVDHAITSSPGALIFVSFVAVAREGLETVLFLAGAETGSSSGTEVVVGGLIGLVISSVIGLIVYKGSGRVNLGAFFRWTGALLILFAAGLFAKGIHEFRELLEINTSTIADPVWTITSGPFSNGHTIHDFLKGLFGWSPTPERLRVLAYIASLLPVAWYYFINPASHVRPSDEAREAQAHEPAQVV